MLGVYAGAAAVSVIAFLSSSSTHALPIQHAPGVFVKQVVAVESVIVDEKGNKIGLQKMDVDADLLAANHNDLKLALEQQQQRQQQKEQNQQQQQNPDQKMSLLVDIKSVPVVETGTLAERFAYAYSRQNGLRHIFAVNSAEPVLKSSLQSLPMCDVAVIRSPLQLQQQQQQQQQKQHTTMMIDYLLVPAGTAANKHEYILSSMHAFSKRALVHLKGCTDDRVGCEETERLLKSAGWHTAVAIDDTNRDELVMTSGNPKDPRSRLEQTLDAVFAGLLAPNDKRYKTMRRVAELAILRGAQVFVETGTARNGERNCGGDGCSTIIFGRLMELMASLNPQQAPLLHTVDINPQAIRESRQAASRVSSRISYHAADSVKFLDAFAQPIDILYLDSYDFNGSNPQPSQRHHLKELVMSWDNLHANTVIIVDDCGLSDMGKCKLVHEHLMYAGWRMDTDGYQRVYVRQ